MVEAGRAVAVPPVKGRLDGGCVGGGIGDVEGKRSGLGPVCLSGAGSCRDPSQANQAGVDSTFIWVRLQE